MESNDIVKELNFGNTASTGLIRGIAKLGEAVGSTLGAGGKSVIIEDGNGLPVVTKDGVTVANSIVLADPIENIGANLVKDAARKTVKEAGDGTTTATLLAWAVLKESLIAVKNGTKVRAIKEHNSQALDLAIKHIDKSKKKVVGEDKSFNRQLLDSVATISANNDKDLGKIISTAFYMAGERGTVMMDNNEDPCVEIENIRGSSFNLGLKNPYFVTNNNKDKAELENPYVLIVDSTIPNTKRIQRILEHVLGTKQSLLIIADADKSVLNNLAANKVKNGLNVNIVDAPIQGVSRKDTLDDLATLTGATVINENLGDSLDVIDLSVLGRCTKAVTSDYETVITVDETKEDDIAVAVEVLQERLSNTHYPALRKKIEKRIGTLLGKVSLVKVGAETEVELNELKDRVEDAICATKAAVKEGVVPGGGVTLKDISHKLASKQGKFDHFAKALLWPSLKIANNAGFELEGLDLRKGYGLDAITGKIVRVANKGILDPALVTKSALKNAVSVANTIISTDCIINNIRIK
jgi:chaperonin GroEL